ncbi:MAG TPA: hypothetical protein VGF99_21370 [Myxococcota bacterium]
MKITPRPITTTSMASTAPVATTATTAKTPSTTNTTTTTTTSTPTLHATTTGVAHSPLPAPHVDVADRAGKTAALHALKGLPIGRTFAAIDLGSSSGKMIVAKQTADGVVTLLDQKIGCALGKNVVNGTAIPDDNIDRAISALQQFVDVAAQHGVAVDDIPLITTAVVRNASNGAAFVDRVRRDVGITARVLSGDDEADIGFRGALGSMLATPGRYATLDLGGGSFQIAVGTDKGLEAGGSTQVGSNAILDTMINPRVDDAGIVDAAVFAHVDSELKRTAPLPLGDDVVAGRTLVATGGVSKFLRLHLGTDVIGRDEIDRVRRQLGALPIVDRAAFVAVGKSDDDKQALGIGTTAGANDYGKKLPASLSLLLHIVDGLGLDSIRVSATDARHALIHGAIATATR